jgi:uncharacterized membrane protein
MPFGTKLAKVMLRRHLELDLLVIDVLTLLLVAAVLAPPVALLREILGLVFILFSPGYVLVAALFPGPKRPGNAARLSLSLALSVAAGVFIGLILTVSPWGFTLNSVLAAISAFTLVVSGLAWYLRQRHNHKDESNGKTPSFIPGALQCFRSAGRGYRSLVIILLCVICGGLGLLSYIMFRPLPAQPFTEFYILGAGGQAEAYPRELHAGEEGQVIIGIVNHEARPTSYHVQVKARGEPGYELASITLNPGEKWQRDFTFTIQKAGTNQKVEFLLFKEAGAPDEARYIWVNVIE